VSPAIESSVEQYLTSRVDATQSTTANHRYRLRKWKHFCDNQNVQTTQEIDGQTIEHYRTEILSNECSIVTNQNNLQTFRVYLRYLERVEACKQGLADKVIIPQVTNEEESKDVHLTHERAQQIIDYLARYEWASLDHIIFHLCYHTGLRQGSLYALDVSDWHPDKQVLDIRNREGTPLKLRERGERNLTIADNQLARAMNEYLDEVRVEVTDERGRHPFFASKHGRYHCQSIQKVFYKVTQPCYFAGKCPVDDQNIETCQYRHHDHRSKCPESVSSHPIRRSAITHHLDSQVPKQIVSERMNVDEATLDQHYDARSKEQKRENRQKYLDSIGE